MQAGHERGSQFKIWYFYDLPKMETVKQLLFCRINELLDLTLNGNAVIFPPVSLSLPSFHHYVDLF